MRRPIGKKTGCALSTVTATVTVYVGLFSLPVVGEGE